MEKNKRKLIEAISELKEIDYSKEPELKKIYERLLKGRKQFEEVLEKNLQALMQISSLDLTMQFQTDKILEISQKVVKASEVIFGTSIEGSNAENQHEALTNTIIEASAETQEVYKKIEMGQEELTEIKEVSSQTIKVSNEMKQDMEKLFQVIHQMDNLISGIDTISMQTNLLSLNASIEAARAGEAGKGFAVVADEIRELSAETQKLTSNIGEFVEVIKNASQKSAESVSHTITSLEMMTEKIENIWGLNHENQQRVSKVNDSISSLAAVSEEISSSMTEMENQLRDSTSFMRDVNIDLRKAIEPVKGIEKALDSAAKQMGNMTRDAFFRLHRTEFAKYIGSAITAHQTWLANLRKMVTEKTIIPLQLNDKKCGFGHFYYAITPEIKEIQAIWDALGEKHKKFHGYGSSVIHALLDGNSAHAESLYMEAENYSRELISDLRKIQQYMES